MSNLLRFQLWLIVFTLLLAGIAVLLQYFVPAAIADPGIWHVLSGVALISYIALRISLQPTDDEERRGQYLFVGIVIRLLLGMAYITFLMRYFNFRGLAFILDFIVIYFAYIMFDVIFILSTLRPNSKKG